MRRGRRAAWRDRPGAVYAGRVLGRPARASRSGAATRHGARAGRRLRATRVRWLSGRGMRFRLMYERQAYELDGRWRFWGGLAVGVVDGGRGLVDQQAAAASRSGSRSGTSARSRRWSSGGVLVRCAGRDAVGAARAVGGVGGGRLRVQPADARGATSGRTGTWRRCAGRRTTPARCCGPRWRWAPRRTGTGAAATRSSGTATRRPRRSGDHQPLLAPVLSGRDRRELDGERFIDEGADFRNYTYAKYGAEVLRQPDGRGVPGVRRAVGAGLLRTIDYEAPGATRVEAPSLRRARRRRSGSTPSASSGPCASTTPRSSGGAVRSRRSRTGCAPKGSRCPSPTGRCRWTRRRYVAFPVTCGITFTFGGLRVDDDARVLDLGGRPIPGLYAVRRAGRRAVLPQLPGRLRPDRGHRVRARGRATRPQIRHRRARSTAVLRMRRRAALGDR